VAREDQQPDEAPRPVITIRPGKYVAVPLGATGGAGASGSGFWQRLLRRGKPSASARQLKFTREGKFFVGITFGVGFAALNTANNLLYLLLGMLLALIVVSGVMSELSLRGLSVVRKLPQRAQVGKAHVVEIEVFNRKQRVPSYAIEVEDLREGLPADKRCFFLKISPNSAQVAAYRRTPSRRGRDSHTGFRIATRFPFGLFEKSREITAADVLLIYPAVDAVQVATSRGGNVVGAVHSLHEGRGDEVFGLRNYRDGDDLRDVHWKSTARAGHMVVRQRAREHDPRVSVALDLYRRPESGAGFADEFERRVRHAASLAVAHLRRGTGVTLALSTGRSAFADKATGADSILRVLALVEPVAAPASAITLKATTPAQPAGRLMKGGAVA
jgi:uncharacterized protein (DUF58 family)